MRLAEQRLGDAAHSSHAHRVAAEGRSLHGPAWVAPFAESPDGADDVAGGRWVFVILVRAAWERGSMLMQLPEGTR
jgi:hypothetical protein